MTVDDDLQRRLQSAERELFQHPGYVEYAACEAYRFTLDSVFLRNWGELHALLERAAHDPKLAIELMQNMYRPDVREAFEAETRQRLHNYLAATMTLVDHSRRMARGRTGELAEALETKKLELLANAEVPFMQDLRNFTLHRTLPFLGHTVHVSGVNIGATQITAEVELSASDLASWDGWTARSKTFLGGQGERVVLRPLVRRHGQLVAEFNAWLYNALAKANEPALAEVNELTVKRNAIATGMDDDEARRLTQNLTNMRATPKSDVPGDPMAAIWPALQSPDAVGPELPE